MFGRKVALLFIFVKVLFSKSFLEKKFSVSEFKMSDAVTISVWENQIRFFWFLRTELKEMTSSTVAYEHEKDINYF